MSNSPSAANVAAERYASALFELARDTGVLEVVEADCKVLNEMLSDSTELRAALASPVHASEEKAKVLSTLAAKAGLSNLSTKFIGTVGENGRSADLQARTHAFARAMARHRGATAAQVTSAQRLSEAQLNELKAALAKAIGKDVDVTTAVSEDLLGGLIVKVGSRMFDSSLKTKLEGLKVAMKGA